MGAALADITVLERIVAEVGVRFPHGVYRSLDAVAAPRRVAGGNAISDGSAVRNITRRKRVEIIASDQAAHPRGEVGDAQCRLQAELALERQVVLLDTRGLEVERN